MGATRASALRMGLACQSKSFDVRGLDLPGLLGWLGLNEKVPGVCTKMAVLGYLMRQRVLRWTVDMRMLRYLPSFLRPPIIVLASYEAGCSQTLGLSVLVNGRRVEATKTCKAAMEIASSADLPLWEDASEPRVVT
jgi:hypothetical protein